MGKREKFFKHPRHFVTRGRLGRITNWTRIGKSLSIDRLIHAKRTVKSGYGHTGDLKKFRMPKLRMGKLRL